MNYLSIQILEDPWISELSLVENTARIDASAVDPGPKVTQFMTPVWTWDIARLGTVFHPLLIETISIIMISQRSGDDVAL